MTIKTTLKRDGSVQAYEPIKILRWVLWGSKGIEKAIDWQELVQSVTAELYEGIDTQSIQLKVVQKCNSKHSSNYDLLAGRLYASHIRKKLFNDKIPKLKDHVKRLISLGYMLDLGYTDEQYDLFETIIDHERDFGLKYSQVLQLFNKYAITNRVTHEKFETPQFVAMRMALALSAGEKDIPAAVRENYNMFSLFVGNAPTPNYTNLGTPHRGLISCCLYTTDDDAESLAIGDHIAYRMTCMSAGIGGYINTRSVGDPVKGGIVRHKGKMGYYKSVAAAVNANTQQCFHENTEIMTDRGFVRFDKLTEDTLVAQVHDDVTVSFVTPEARQVYDYNGPMYHFANIQGDYASCVTPNHRVAWVDGKTSEIRHTEAQSFVPTGKYFLRGAHAPSGDDYELTSHEKLQIVMSLSMNSIDLQDGGRVHTLYSQRGKSEYLYQLLMSLNISHARSYAEAMCKCYLEEDVAPITLTNKTRQQLQAYLALYFKLLDADTVLGAPTHTANLIQAIATLCGIHTKTFVHSDDVCFMTLTEQGISLDASKTYTSVTNVDSKVYCVTVPTGNVIVRFDGCVTVSGNSRGGACTTYFTCYDPEVLDLIHLQNPRTPQKKQIRDIHFAIEFNEYFYKKLLKNEDVFLFTSYSAPELHKAFFSKDTERFAQLYEELEADPTFKKTYLSSTKIAVAAGRQFHETATLYSANMTEMNRHTPFLEPIVSSNLCTAPETPILTKEYGYRPIISLVGKDVHVWNGEGWSLAQPVKTGENQPLLSVTLSTGITPDFTPYHKWHIQTEAGVIVKTTDELTFGDELLAANIPTLESRSNTTPLDVDQLTNKEAIKLVVPTVQTPIADTLKWVDAFQKHFGSSINSSPVYACDDQVFMTAVYYCLQELGVTSRLSYHVYTTFLTISDAGSNKLQFLKNKHIHDTATDFEYEAVAEKPVTVVSVTRKGRISDTYCFTEPKRHLGVFAGVLCGNCTEIAQVTIPYKTMEDLYDPEDRPGKGEISLCGLGGIVPSAVYQEHNFDKIERDSLEFTLQSDIEYFNVAYRQLKMISTCIRTNDYVFPHLKTTALGRMNAGVGMIGLAYDLAKRNYTYTSDEGIKYIHFLAERHAFMLIAASLKIGQEEGNAPYMHKTKWPSGWLPIDTYNKNVDTIADFKLYYPWELLRQAVIANGGIAHSSLFTMMPTESCLDSTTEIQTASGLMTLKDIFELSGYTLEQAQQNHDPVIGGTWYDLKEPVIVKTRFGDKTVTRAWYNGQSPYMEITLENGEVINATLGHKFLVRRDGLEVWVETPGLIDGDTIVTVEGYHVTISALELKDANTKHFIDIEVPDVHEYLLRGGIVSHNSSKAAGKPNAYYPVRDLHMLKTDGSNSIDFIVPEADEIGHQYQSAWLIPALRQTQVTAVIQKFADHSLSSDRYIDRVKTPELKASYLVDEIVYDYIYGVKSRYYTNSKTTSGVNLTTATTTPDVPAQEVLAAEDTERGCAGGFCSL